MAPSLEAYLQYSITWMRLSFVCETRTRDQLPFSYPLLSEFKSNNGTHEVDGVFSGTQYDKGWIMSHPMSCVGMKPIYSMHGAVWMRRIEQAAIWQPARFPPVPQIILPGQ